MLAELTKRFVVSLYHVRGLSLNQSLFTATDNTRQNGQSDLIGLYPLVLSCSGISRKLKKQRGPRQQAEIKRGPAEPIGCKCVGPLSVAAPACKIVERIILDGVSRRCWC